MQTKMTTAEFMRERVLAGIKKTVEDLGYEIVDFNDRIVRGKDGVYYNFEFIEEAKLKDPSYDSFLRDEDSKGLTQRIKVGEFAASIEYENLAIFEEHFTQEEVAHVDHFDADEQVTFSAIMKLSIFEICYGAQPTEDYTDHVTCNDCNTGSLYLEKGSTKCPVCGSVGTLGWFDGKYLNV